MTAPQISKELINEDIIEQVANFIKVHLTETIFPHYDTVYKTASHEGISGKGGSNAKRKLMGQFNSSTASGATLLSKQKHMHHFYNRMREILALVGELVCQIDLTDTIIITLSSLSVSFSFCFSWYYLGQI